MANWNCNYIYGVTPTHDYQEYGVYGESIDTATVPLEYVGPIYSVLYTGVTSYELNGTTYYNYNLYEIPVFSSSDYDSMPSDLRSSYVLSSTSYYHSFSTSISYNSSSNNSHTVENHGLLTENLNSSYNSFPSLGENDSTNNENISCPSTQVENHTDIKDENSNSEIVIESHNTSAFTTQAIVNNTIEYNALGQDNTVSETDIDENYEEYLLIYVDNKILNWSAEIEVDDRKENEKVIYEESKILDNSVEREDGDMKESEKVIYEESKIADWSVETENDDMKESEKVIYEESKIADWSVEIEENDMKESEKVIYEESKISDDSVETEDFDMKESEKIIYEESKITDWSVETEDADTKEGEKAIYEESKILDWSVEIEDDVVQSERVLYEECVHQSLFTEETTVLDWSVEVPDNDVKNAEDDNFNKENSSTDSDIDPNYSTADIKYLKEKLYIEALSGHLYLKESVPVVDVLPVIEEEYESVEENDTLEWVVVNGLKDREKNIPDGTKQNIESDVAFATCETFIENHAKESTIFFEEMKENYLNLIENGLKTVPICNLSQQNLSNHEGSTIESDERYFNDDNIQMNETKYFSLKKESTVETSSKESELFVENVSQLVETDHVFNAASQEHQFGKENCEPWCCNDEALLKSDEDVKLNEVISNQTDRNLIMNATAHVSLNTSPHGEYYSKANEVKIMKNGENASRRRSKKKSSGFRKWFTNLFCCVWKKNSSDSFD